MIFEKPSTETRVSFEVGMWQLGGYALYLELEISNWAEGETDWRHSQVLSRYVTESLARVFAHQTILDLVKHSRYR